MSDFLFDPIPELTEADLERVVHEFYSRVRRDAEIGPIFNDAIRDWPEHLDKLSAFWSSVMFTSGRYKGRPMPAHIRHAGRITPHGFARWLALWRETSDDLLPARHAAAMQEKAGRIAESLMLGIDFHLGRLPSVARQA
ncbi:MAG: group III truncated hemoglobin [Sphingomonas sp.]